MPILVYQNRYSDTEEEHENVKCLQKNRQMDAQQSIRKTQTGKKLLFNSRQVFRNDYKIGFFLPSEEDLLLATFLNYQHGIKPQEKPRDMHVQFVLLMHRFCTEYQLTRFEVNV